MGDFSANFHRPESGIHTVEGNVAGSRAAALTKKREREQAEFESLKNKIRSDSNRERQNIDSKFDHTSNVTAAERTFRDRTVGLVTAEEFKRAAAGEGPEGEEEKSARLADEEKKKKAAEEEARRRRREKKRKRKAKKRMLSTLSFANEEDAADILAPDDDDEEEEEDGGGTTGAGGAGGVGTAIKSAIHKNPEVDTSFLPDRQREMETQAERERLRAEWIELQEKIKGETLEITYSYWDGSGHRRTVRVQKGDTIAHFLELVRRDLAKDFREMGKVTSDGLLYVKEDLIIPHDISFYDLIATKARGKSGPLFNFDVHDDVRMGTIDVRVEKDESHPGKVVERRWYDRNKHIFPASRWEVFDPAKDYGRYTIHGGEVNKKKK